MQQLVAEMTRPVVLSDRALRQLARIREARRAHLQAHKREPSAKELAAATGFTLGQVETLMATDRAPRGLEQPFSDEEPTAGTFEDLQADPVAEDEYEGVLERMEIEDVRDLSEGLDERERNILYDHYGLGRPAQTLGEIGSHLGLSAERVRQIEERALEKLRVAATSATPLTPS
jgi:RNA polymerase sigma factor (sigma-70 family)